jgi:hypothetical protein
MGKPQQDLEDVEAILTEVRRFGSMSFSDLSDHWEEHPEDRGRWLETSEGRGFPISYEAHLRFVGLTERQKAVAAAGHSLHPERLNKAIRQAFVAVFLIDRRPVEQKFVDRMLNRATQAAAAEHDAITHYLPCVVVYRPTPPQFEVGPVRFLTSEKFISEHREVIERDEADRRQKQIDQLKAAGKWSPQTTPEDMERLQRERLEQAFEYYRSFTWVAEVTVPACDPDISEERAIKAVQGALDVLKLFLGPHRRRGPELRLAREPGPSSISSEIVRRKDGFHVTNIYGGEGAFADEGWYDELRANDPYRHFDRAAAAISGYLDPGVMSAHRDRWLDALNWYGQAVSERQSAAKLVKFVAALERLTVTEESGTEHVTEIVTGRTAFLASHYDTTRPNLGEDTREIYRWRSDLMHGRTSPLAEGIGDVLRLAYEVVRLALFGALVLFQTLEREGKGTSTALEQWFRDVVPLPPNEEPTEEPPSPGAPPR